MSFHRGAANKECWSIQGRRTKIISSASHLHAAKTGREKIQDCNWWIDVLAITRYSAEQGTYAVSPAFLMRRRGEKEKNCLLPQSLSTADFSFALFQMSERLGC